MDLMALARQTHDDLARKVALRIEEMRGELGLTQEAVAEGSRMSRTGYVEKVRNNRNQVFSIDQANAIANYFRRVTGRNLTGWPFVDKKVSEAMDSIVALSEK
jgi:transcriptional regulator with XRE-family HTH domain